MGYKAKTWDRKSPESPYFLLEKGIFKSLNVASVGYVIDRALDSRFDNKVYKYTLKLGPIDTGREEMHYTIYDVACIEGVEITQEDIISGKCLVLVVFLDTNPKNTYSLIHGHNQRVSDKLGTTAGVEDIMHDYRNALIIGKVNKETLKNPGYIDLISNQNIGGIKVFEESPKIKKIISRIPSEYQEVEYIYQEKKEYGGRNNLAFIQSNLSFSDVDSFEIDIAVKDDALQRNIVLCAYNAGTFFVADRKGFYGSSLGNLLYSSSDTNLFKDGERHSLKVSGITSSVKTKITTTWDWQWYSVTYWYGIKFYKNNTLLQELIPCYRKSDNVIGMYDTVSGSFFTNMGSGTFLKGDDVKKDTDITYEVEVATTEDFKGKLIATIQGSETGEYILTKPLEKGKMYLIEYYEDSVGSYNYSTIVLGRDSVSRSCISVINSEDESDLAILELQGDGLKVSIVPSPYSRINGASTVFSEFDTLKIYELPIKL